MYKVWKYLSDDSTDKDFRCGIEKFDRWYDISWRTGEKINRQLPDPLNYFTDSKLKPNDFPKTNTALLVSEKILNVLIEQNISGFDFYKSQINLLDDTILKNYYTLNILEVVSCVDFKKSIYEEIQLGPARVLQFKKLCIDNDKIPKNIKLFRLGEKRPLVIIHQDIKQAFEKAEIKGVWYVNLCEEQNVFGNLAY